MPKIGFLGLGTMGLPMAKNIASAGEDITVFNRTEAKTQAAAEAGCKAAESVKSLLEQSDILIMMLAGPEAIDATVGSLLTDKPGMFAGKLVVDMGTNPPAYTEAMARRVVQAGGGFVNAPVLGSLEPAVAGELLVMASGDEEHLARLAPIFSAVGRAVIPCGEVPKASMMKLAVNLVAISAGMGLFEGVNFAKRAGLNLETFFGMILNGPVGNDLFRMKAKKIMEDDYSEQSSVFTVREVLKHIADTAYQIGANIPTTLVNLNLTTTALNQGMADLDSSAMVKVLEQ